MIAQIIHNPNRKDRLQNILEQTAEQRIKYQIWDATLNVNPIEGCHRSHRKIVQWAQATREPMVWIMEDDCVFTALSAAEEFLKKIPAEFDIYTAGTYGQTCKYNSDDGTMRRMSGTHCYIVHSRFYEKFLSLDVHEHIDVAISNATRPHLCNPMIALQMPGISDVAGDGAEVDYNQSNYVVYPLFNNTLIEFNEQFR